jgi:hypothetical protein
MSSAEPPPIDNKKWTVSASSSIRTVPRHRFPFDNMLLGGTFIAVYLTLMTLRPYFLARTEDGDLLHSRITAISIGCVVFAWLYT